MIFQSNILRVALLLAIGIGSCVDAKPLEEDDGDLHYPLIATAQCNANGSLTLEFPSEVVGKLIMYSEVVFHGDWIKTCEEKPVNERRQLLEPGEEPVYDDEGYWIKILEHGDESSNKIVVHRDDMPRHYHTAIECADKEWQEKRTVQFDDLFLTPSEDYSQVKLTIGNTIFHPTITVFNERGNFVNLGDPVKMEIKIRDENLFGQKSRLESCKLDIPHCDGYVESISILENSSLTPEGSAIGFQAEYTPSGRYSNGRYKRAKYTVEFKAFALANRMPFNFICQASSD